MWYIDDTSDCDCDCVSIGSKSDVTGIGCLFSGEGTANPIEHSKLASAIGSDEELEDLPELEAERDPFLGMHISLGGFTGVVDAIEVGKQSRQRLYWICSDDGDMQRLMSADVAGVLSLKPRALSDAVSSVT